MNRIEENNVVLNNIRYEFQGSTDRIANALEFEKLKLLADISKSLAIIADANVIYKPIRDPKDLFNVFPPKEVIDDGK